jgi:hypothetical protein
MWNVNEATDEQRQVMLDALAQEKAAYDGNGEKERAAAVQKSIDLWKSGGKAQASDEPSESWKREDLDAAARDAGVKEPEKLGNKADVVKAIADAKAAA